uniref:Ubiquitin-like protease family profile domain-containing protein n=1 Tax=Ditylenchus dipsaci TaxID=166011 RepID=A0A915E8C8_9BILA
MKPVVFKWSNKDVLAWLNQLKNRTMKLKDVEAKIFSEYGWKVSKPTISRHLPKEEQKLIIIAINTKFGGAMTAVLEESNLSQSKKGFIRSCCCEEKQEDKRFSELGLRMIDTFYAESSPILVNNFGIQLKKSDIDRLDPGNCLNDVVVNYYLQLLVEENKSKVRFSIRLFLYGCDLSGFCIPTQFFPKLTRESPAAMLNWFTGPSLFCHEIILLPIHTPGHWSLAVIQVKRQRIDYYDSMSGDGSEYIEIIKEYMFLKAKSMNMDQTNLDDWIGFNQKRIPQQTNGHDCGVFLC